MASINNGDDTQTAISSTPTSTATASSSVNLTTLNLYNTLSVNSQWDVESDSWKYTDTANPNLPAEQTQPMGAESTLENDSWKEYCFVIVRKYSKPSRDCSEVTITFKIVLTSPYIVKACRDVMGDVRAVSWNSRPIELDPQLLIAYFPRLEKYEQDLMVRTDHTEEDGHVLKSLGTLLAHIRKHYKQTLERVSILVKNHEITFDLLYAILLPGTVIIQSSPITGETHALKLLATRRGVDRNGQEYWGLNSECLEVATDENKPRSWHGQIGSGDEVTGGQRIRFGMRDSSAHIAQFDGVKKISSLGAYPIEFHSHPERLKVTLLERARKWASLRGMHHVYYEGNAGRGEGEKFKRYSVRSRIMVDKASFSLIDADYCLSNPERMFTPLRDPDGGVVDSLTDPELLLAPPIVYGFSLSDKLWLEFNVNHVTPIEWNDEAFAGLVLPPERKDLLRGLIDAHGSSVSIESPEHFDDLVRGKGKGLVINLFGPPGVGKTLSAEATSEHLHRPLYIVGSGDLGERAFELDHALRRAFTLATTWRAVLLIDEADVFLEERSLHDLKRNAMVAVFLRQLEYYQGILFMTTNRIQTFDEAFLSRIHISLHFDELDVPTKVKIWRAFLGKAGLKGAELEEVLVEKLAVRDFNGRQIKNACSTAMSLAASREERMGYEHLELVLSATEDFMKYFKTGQRVTDRPPETEQDITRFSPVPWWGKRLVNRVNTCITRSRRL